MNGIYPEFYIISAHCKDFREEDNVQRSEVLAYELELAGFGYKQVMGVYNNQEETSFLVVTDDMPNMMRLAELFRQDCMLHSDKNRECSLVWTNDRQPQYCGKWTEVNTIEACGAGNYTRDGDKFYITRRFT